MEHGYKVWTCNMDGLAGKDMWQGVTCTCSIDKQYGHAAQACKMQDAAEKQPGHSAWISSMDMQRRHAAWTSSMDMQHRQEARTCNKDMQHGTRSMNMQQEYAAWT